MAVTIAGRAVPPRLLTELNEFPHDPLAEPAELRDAMARDGYVLCRGALDAEEVAAARAEVFGRLRDVNELQEPPSAGLPTGRSRREELVGEVEGEAIGRWWRSVSEGPRLRRLTHGPRLHALQAALLGEPARAMDMLYLRPVCAGGVSDLVSAATVDPSLPHAVV